MSAPAPRRPERRRRASRRRTLAFRASVWLGALVVAPLLRLLGATWRVAVEGEDPRSVPPPFLGVTWHAGLFCAAVHYRGRDIAIPVSRSRDGDRIDAVLQRLGFGPSPRGSSSRAGHVALKGMIDTCRAGRALGVLADGPRGPARRCKPGVVSVARATGLPIRPVGIAANPALRFPSWDRAFLPLPFSRVAIVAGPPLAIAEDATEAELDAALAEVDRRLDAAQSRAAALVTSGTFLRL